MLDWIDVENVRNLVRQRIPLAADVVLVTGANAQGKSSVLEAVYLLATTKSYRTRDPREAIAHGADFLRIEGQPRTAPGLATALGKKRGERVLSVAECAAKLADYLGLLPTLALAGESSRSIAGSPSERRRFMDRATAAADPSHLVDLGDFRRALLSRNQLLRSGAPDALLEPWDTVFAAAGERVSARRRQQIAAWQDRIGVWPELFPEGAATRLTYRAAGEGESLLERLRTARPSERREGMTLVGPHRDDLALAHGGKNLLRFGSAGQVRAALAALTLAQLEQVRRTRGTEAGASRPLLLLDDVDTDLDSKRLAAFLGAAAGGGQVIAASSKPELTLAGLAAHHVKLNVAGGVVSDATAR
jgi:DNA replication and repair protein RecF